MHGHMYSDSLGAAAGCAPERSSLGGVPSVSNAGVVGGIIHLAAVFRVAHIRLRRAVEHAVQRRVPAARDLPEHLAMKVSPRPVRVPAARLRRPMAAAQTLWASRRNFGDLTDESVNLRAPLTVGPKAKPNHWRERRQVPLERPSRPRQRPVPVTVALNSGPPVVARHASRALVRRRHPEVRMVRFRERL